MYLKYSTKFKAYNIIHWIFQKNNLFFRSKKFYYKKFLTSKSFQAFKTKGGNKCPALSQTADKIS